MKRTSICHSLALGVAALAISMPALASSTPPPHGQSYTDSGIYRRTIDVTPQTHSVNVNAGEIIRFTSTTTGKSFTWQFKNGGVKAFDLRRVAPPGTFNHQVMAYVAPNMNRME